MKEVIKKKEAIKEAGEMYAAGGIDEEWTKRSSLMIKLRLKKMDTG